MKLYAVAKGRKTGIFDNWEECQESTKGFTDAKFRKFNNYEDAENYLLKFTDSEESYDRASIIENYYIASNALMNIGTTKNIPEDLANIAVDASRAVLKIVNYLNSLN